MSDTVGPYAACPNASKLWCGNIEQVASTADQLLINLWLVATHLRMMHENNMHETMHDDRVHEYTAYITYKAWTIECMDIQFT